MMIYLASPHTHAVKAVVDQRYQDVLQATAILMGKNYIVYSPIVYTHPVFRHAEQAIGKNPTEARLSKWTHQQWLLFDEHMMERCQECWVLMLDGWQDSKGIKYEMTYFVNADKPVGFYTMQDIVNLEMNKHDH